MEGKIIAIQIYICKFFPDLLHHLKVDSKKVNGDIPKTCWIMQIGNNKLWSDFNSFQTKEDFYNRCSNYLKRLDNE